MNADMRATLLGLALSGGALLAGPITKADEPRTKQNCTTLFHELNTSKSGRLTIEEASKSRDVMATLDAPSLWKKGYITEDEFTPLCVTKDSVGPHG